MSRWTRPTASVFSLARTPKPRTFVPGIALSLVLGLVLLTGPASAETYRFEADSLDVRNLIGTVTVEAGGSDFEVQVDLQGSDAARLKVDPNEGRNAQLSVRFPVDETSRFVYPELGRGSTTSFNIGSRDHDSWLESVLGAFRGRIRVSGSGSGAQMWADITVKVPRGGQVEVHHGVGKIFATNVDGDLNLDTQSGSIEISGVNGSLRADTGSGRITARGVEGDLVLDTGSGAVRLEDSNGQDISVDTGSGGVTLRNVGARRLSVDTGSGGIEASGVSADDASFDTGSGGVDVEFDRIGTGRYEVDTGSGSISVVLPAGTGAEISADTGSGSISIDLPGVDYQHKERDEVEATVGGGGARISLSAGSGSIRIRDR